jgi:hypothetical protein
METQPLGLPEPTPGPARCPNHPDKNVLGACARCGTFFCALDYEELNGKDYCDTCAAHPDTDYLEAFRLKNWGKRDAWAWLIGFGALVNITLGAVTLVNSQEAAATVGAVIILIAGAVGVCFWMGLPFARLALCILMGLFTVISFSTAGPEAARAVIPFAVTIAMYRDTRNKLFFKQEVSREALQKAWHLYENNVVARMGFALGIVGLLLWPLAPFGLVCSIIGLRRVNPDSNPPVGRKGQAIAGIVLSALSMVGWGGFLVYGLLRKFH